IRKVTPSGVVTTLAGTAGAFGWSDGTGSAARFGGPSGIAVDNASGSLYVADTNTNTIREITADAVVTTHGGCPFCIGTEASGMFNDPQGIAISATGSLYVADTGNNTIRTDAPITRSLVVDFGSQYGIWIRRGDEWSQLHPYT